MAPEVLQKGAMAMPADVYSFAMLMLELWTGEIVYSGINSHQVALRQALPARLRLPKPRCPMRLKGLRPSREGLLRQASMPEARAWGRAWQNRLWDSFQGLWLHCQVTGLPVFAHTRA